MAQLIIEWREVLRKAWSIRLMLIAGGLTGAESVINVVGTDWMPEWAPAWARSLLILAVIGGAFVTRLLAQRNMGDSGVQSGG